MSELSSIKELLHSFKENPDETVYNELQKKLEELEYSDRFKPYGLLFESQEEDVVKDFKGKKVIPTQVDDLNILKDKNGKSNMLLEGDNYLALKLLEKTHKDSIDVIYIDPPYNTGNKDFVYNDSFVNNEDAYKHSKWLSFMNTRLQIARKLLKDDGLIFISIDDNEQAQLKLLCDKVFGEHNAVGNVIWDKGATGKNDVKGFKSGTEYILVYSKNWSSDTACINKVEDSDLDKYKLKDDYLDERGPYYLITLDQGALGYVESLDFGVYSDKYGVEVFPNGRTAKMENNEDEHRWRWGAEKVAWGLENDMLEFKKSKGKIRVYTKQYLKVDNNLEPIDRGLVPSDLLNGLPTRRGKDLITDILGKGVFSYPKPVDLVKWVVDRHTNKSSTVLDFFAGSGTTGHAVMELNKEDGGNRQFILATNNEVSNEKELQLLLDKQLIPERPTSKRGKPYKDWLKQVEEFENTPEYAEFLLSDDYQQLGIARSVTYERLKRVINGYTTPKGKEVEGIPNNLKYIKLDTVPESNIDYSQKDVVFFKEEVTEDLDAEFYKGLNDMKVVYVVGDSEEVLDALEEAKEQHKDKEIVIYTDRLTRNEFNGKEELEYIKPFPKL